jgi:hypothetical protein
LENNEEILEDVTRKKADQVHLFQKTKFLTKSGLKKLQRRKEYLK